jgi:hypothetical protein
MSAKFIYLVGQVGSFGPCFLVQPELVISCDVTFNLTFIDLKLRTIYEDLRSSKCFHQDNL